MKRVALTELAQIAVSELQKGVVLDVVSAKIAGYLVSTNRAHEVDALLRRIEAEFDRLGQARVRITSATKLTPTTVQKLASKIGSEAKFAELVIDEDVLGGAKVETFKTRIDLTIRAKLDSFRSAVRGA